MNARWTAGNRVKLLENGEAFFPSVFEAIDRAQREVIVETFILFEDEVGHGLRDALCAAAARGVDVDLMVDGFGSADLSPAFVASLVDAGVRLRSFDPSTRLFGVRLNVLRRMHRKLVVVDGQRAYVGGINYSADHLKSFGPQAKQDYAVWVEGPIVGQIQGFARSMTQRDGRSARAPRAEVAMPGGAEALFVTRDNVEHRNDIERHYRAAIRSARKRVLIANAYFFPGYRLLRELRRAARRGVEVRLILQGEPDLPIVKSAASMLYKHLQADGVQIYEYGRRPLHGKVAVVDDDWSTVGSSNLDPSSLSLNLEANLVVRDAGFSAELRSKLEQLMAEDCRRVAPASNERLSLWQQLRSAVVFHFLRSFPNWAARLPRHAPKLVLPHARAEGPLVAASGPPEAMSSEAPHAR